MILRVKPTCDLIAQKAKSAAFNPFLSPRWINDAVLRDTGQYVSLTPGVRGSTLSFIKDLDRLMTKDERIGTAAKLLLARGREAAVNYHAIFDDLTSLRDIIVLSKYFQAIHAAAEEQRRKYQLVIPPLLCTLPCPYIRLDRKSKIVAYHQHPDWLRRIEISLDGSCSCHVWDHAVPPHEIYGPLIHNSLEFHSLAEVWFAQPDLRTNRVDLVNPAAIRRALHSDYPDFG